MTETWHLVTEFFASVGYGLLSAFVPLFNTEVYIVATQALGLATAVTAAIGAAVGQTMGKTIIVLGLRHGTRLPFLAKHLERLKQRPRRRADDSKAGRVSTAYRRWSTRLLDIAGHSRWGALIVALAGATTVPPIIALQFIIPATPMPAWLFAVAMFTGRCALFLAIAFGASALIERLF